MADTVGGENVEETEADATNGSKQLGIGKTINQYMDIRRTMTW